MQHFQTIMSSPGIIYLLEIDGYLNILNTSLTLDLAAVAIHLRFLMGGRRPEAMVLELRVHKEFIDTMGQILKVL